MGSSYPQPYYKNFSVGYSSKNFNVSPIRQWYLVAARKLGILPLDEAILKLMNDYNIPYDVARNAIFESDEGFDFGIELVFEVSFGHYVEHYSTRKAIEYLLSQKVKPKEDITEVEYEEDGQE